MCDVKGQKLHGAVWSLTSFLSLPLTLWSGVTNSNRFSNVASDKRRTHVHTLTHWKILSLSPFPQTLVVCAWDSGSPATVSRAAVHSVSIDLHDWASPSSPLKFGPYLVRLCSNPGSQAVFRVLQGSLLAALASLVVVVELHYGSCDGCSFCGGQEAPLSAQLPVSLQPQRSQVPSLR